MSGGHCDGDESATEKLLVTLNTQIFEGACACVPREPRRRRNPPDHPATCVNNAEISARRCPFTVVFVPSLANNLADRLPPRPLDKSTAPFNPRLSPYFFSFGLPSFLPSFFPTDHSFIFPFYPIIPCQFPRLSYFPREGRHILANKLFRVSRNKRGWVGAWVGLGVGNWE